MKTNPNNSAFPWIDSVDGYTVNHGGLTKREYFAAMAMQGILAANEKIEFGDYGRTRQMTASEVARESIYKADALIAELNKETKTS